MRPLLLLAVLALSGCSVLYATGIDLVYSYAALPETHVRRGVPYADDANPKHRLNLFLPLADSVRGGGPWPTVVFVHGGGWDSGDRDFTFGREDVYNNVGRFFARHGVGAAVVSYRLLPEAEWDGQAADVAAAVAWVSRNVAAYGGNPEALVLMGHSAGAQHVTRVALDPSLLEAEGVGPGVVCGAIPVSGAALDLTDRETFALSDNFDYYSARFAPDHVPLPEAPAEPFAWQGEASPLRFVSADAPPFLIVYAGGESRALQRQSQLLAAALERARVPTEVVVSPGLSHTRIVPTLSRGDRPAGRAALRFVRGLRCR